MERNFGQSVSTLVSRLPEVGNKALQLGDVMRSEISRRYGAKAAFLGVQKDMEADARKSIELSERLFSIARDDSVVVSEVRLALHASSNLASQPRIKPELESFILGLEEVRQQTPESANVRSDEHVSQVQSDNR